MKKMFLNLIAIASTCCCLFKGAKNISNKNVFDTQINNQIEAERLDDKDAVERLEGEKPLKALTDPPEYPQYINLDRKDDHFGGGQVIDPKWGEITGTISLYSGWDQFWFGGGALDEDWYTIHTIEYRKYRIDFDTPSRTNCYALSIYKIKGMATAESSGLQLITTIRGDSSVTVDLQETGTYYFRVTCDNENNVVENGNYTIFYNDIKVDTSFSLNSYNKTQYKMAIWQNDFIPRGVNRWSPGNCQEFYYYHSAGTNPTSRGDANMIYNLASDERVLDSVIYIWGTEEIDILLQVLRKIEAKVEADFRNQQILSATASVCNDASGLIISIVGTALSETFKFASNVLTGVGIFMTVVSLINGLSGLLSRSNYLVDLKSFIDILSTSCHWVSQHNIEDAVICIPRYSYFTMSVTVKDRAATQRKYWNFTYVEPDESYREYYDFMDDSITNYQTAYHNNVPETYHGRITAFKSGREFMQFFGKNIDDYFDPNSPAAADVTSVTNEPLYEKQLTFNKDNGFIRYAKVKFQTGGSTLFFTRGGRSTTIQIYNENMSTLYVSKKGGGFGGNALCSYYVSPNVTYLVKVTMTTNNQEVQERAYLDAIQSKTYDNSWNYKIPTSYSDIGHIAGAPFEGFFEFTKNRSTIIMFTAEHTGNYLFSTHYSDVYHLIPLSLDGANNWGYYHRCDTGTLNADYIPVDEEIPYLIVVARNDRFADVPSSGALHSFGMLIVER